MKRVLFCMVVAALCLSACGNKGDLRLPDDAAADNSPALSDSSAILLENTPMIP